MLSCLHEPLVWNLSRKTENNNVLWLIKNYEDSIKAVTGNEYATIEGLPVKEGNGARVLVPLLPSKIVLCSHVPTVFLTCSLFNIPA